jgi:hypothetical protein
VTFVRVYTERWLEEPSPGPEVSRTSGGLVGVFLTKSVEKLIKQTKDAEHWPSKRFGAVDLAVLA